MKIALLTYSTKPRGGVVHTLALAEALAALGQDVTVWTLGRGGDGGFFRPVDPAVRLSVVPFPDGEPGEGIGPRILRSIAVLRAAFPADAFDIVHAQDCISANAVLPPLPRGGLGGASPREVPCLRTVHHVDHFSTPELVACHDRAIRRPFGIVCVSQAVADELAADWGIRATVIPNGVDSGRFARAASSAPAAVAARARWQAQFGRYVLAVGGIEPRKGSLDLLSAYALLRDSKPDVRLVVAGGETLFDYRDYRASWEERSASLFSAAPESAPVVLGAVPDDALPSLVAAAAAFCFPSVREGFGLAALEALAAGVPLVTRSLPVLREVFDGAARFAADPAGFAESLRLALDSPDSLREAGQELAARYTWAAAARAHLAAYERYLA